MNTIPDVPALRGFAAIGLRSNCGCQACQDPASGQRLTSVTDVPADTSIRAARPELMLTFRLGPGDCLVFDNTRILHARTAFAATGRRHLQGCYADLDGGASTLALLRR